MTSKVSPQNDTNAVSHIRCSLICRLSAISRHCQFICQQFTLVTVPRLFFLISQHFHRIKLNVMRDNCIAVDWNRILSRSLFPSLKEKSSVEARKSSFFCQNLNESCDMRARDGTFFLNSFVASLLNEFKCN